MKLLQAQLSTNLFGRAYRALIRALSYPELDAVGGLPETLNNRSCEENNSKKQYKSGDNN